MTRLLIIDDNEINAELLEMTAEELDYETEVALNAEDGLDFLVKSSYDLVLLDLHMPGMTGIELLTRLKSENPNGADPDVFIVTADTEIELSDVDELTMVKGIIRKPLDIDEISQLLGARENVC